MKEIRIRCGNDSVKFQSTIQDKVKNDADTYIHTHVYGSNKKGCTHMYMYMYMYAYPQIDKEGRDVYTHTIYICTHTTTQQAHSPKGLKAS